MNTLSLLRFIPKSQETSKKTFSFEELRQLWSYPICNRNPVQFGSGDQGSIFQIRHATAPL